MNKKEELIKLIEETENYKLICFMLGIAKGAEKSQDGQV